MLAFKANASIISAIAVWIGIVAQAKEINTICVGKETANTAVVYLHGLDSLTPSLQEENNRRTLSQLADELGFRLAIARSGFSCKDKLCWPQKTPEEHKDTYTLLTKALSTCLTKHTKSWGLLGFSNGGYFASKVAQYCYLDGPKWIIASGSAGSLIKDTQEKPAQCPKLTVMIGDQDITRNNAKRYAESMKTAGFKVSFNLFAGKHELLKKPLLIQLRELIKD